MSRTNEECVKNRAIGAPALVHEGIAHQDSVVTFRAGRNQRHRALDQLLHALDVLDRVGGQIGERPRARRAFAPAVHFFVNGFNRGLIRRMRGKVIDHVVVEAIAGADLHRLHPVEHVDLRERDARDPADRAALAHQHRVDAR